MFKKVLVAEDIDSITGGLENILKELSISKIDHVKYCDDAVLKIKRALFDKEPYDLLITDLSFEKDYRKQKITSGNELLIIAKELQPELKTIAYSVEDRPNCIKELFNKNSVNGYVCKGRNSLNELKKTISILNTEQVYISNEIQQKLKNNITIEIEPFDVSLLSHLASGLSQDEISEIFKSKSVKPSSLSSIEKRINKLKIYFKANTTIHLISIVKDLGLI